MKLLYLFAGILFFLTAHPAKAVPPPDFIFNVTSQIAQFFSISVILFSAVGSVIYRFFQQRFAGKRKFVLWTLIGFTALAVSAGGAWIYGRSIQQREMERWLSESKTGDASTAARVDLDQGSAVARSAQPTDNLDQLTFGDEKSANPPAIQPQDVVSQFIRRYYENIATHQFSDAYAMSKKSVSFETFTAWYASTTDISIDRLQRIDQTASSLELTLTEEGRTTRYGVLMDVKLDHSGLPIQIDHSSVRTLSQPFASSTDAEAFAQTPSTDYFSTHAGMPEAISNADFHTVINKAQTPFLIIDARENIEFENGHFPDAMHIRFADLKAGRWIELPTDQPIYVFCWSGIRGKEVVEFLRSKKILAQYLEKGANGWVADGGKWIGEIAFLKIYTDDRYKRVFTLNEFEDSIKDRVVVVDSRPPAVFNTWHIPGSINIPLMYTPSIGIDQAFAQVPTHSKVITVCDEYVNCFDAKLTGVELERRGHTFLGRFAEPWKLK
jgi:rhodanese-related sulfurtransferase